MNNWSLLEVEASEDSPGYYFAKFFKDGDPPLEVLLTLWRNPDASTLIVRSEVETAIPFEIAAISPSQFRAIPYGHLTSLAEPYIEEIVRDGRYTATTPLEPETLSEMYDFAALRKEWPKGDLQKVSAAVAEVYLSAIGLGTPPKEAVAKAFSTSLTTAGRMIAKARELDILKVQSVGGRPKRKK